MFRSGGTATTATIGTVAEGPTLQLASVVLPSVHDSAAAWRLPRVNGTTAARSRAGSAAATKRRATKKYEQQRKSSNERRAVCSTSPPARSSRRCLITRRAQGPAGLGCRGSFYASEAQIGRD